MKIAINLQDYIEDMKGKSQVFTHLDNDGTYRHFPVEIMFKIGEQYGGRCKQILRALIPIEKRNVEWVRANMGIEQDRVDRLVSPYLERPMIGIKWPDGTLTVIDGNHRVIKLYEQGITEAKCYIFDYPFWEGLLIDLPNDPAALTSKSGILEAERKKHHG